MSILTFDLPPKLDQAEVHRLIEISREKKFSAIFFNWSKCEQTDNISLCLLLNLIYLYEENGINASHTSGEKNPYFTEKIKPFFSFPAKSLELQQTNIGAFLAAVDDESTAVSRATALIRYLKSTSHLSKLNLNQIEILFSELYMNLCQHSWARNGIAFVSINPKMHTIEFIISDIGVGIPRNIKDAFNEFEDKSDVEAIKHATVDYVTTKSTPQNYGRGLSTMKTMIESLNGKATIYSGEGILIIEREKETLLDSPIFNHGTQISILLDFRNFEEESSSSFTEEVTFG